MTTYAKTNTKTPNNLTTSIIIRHKNTKGLVTATQLGVKYGFSPIKTNMILAEIGWITKAPKGWMLTESGSKLGGVQNIANDTGNRYIRWPQDIIKNATLNSMIAELTSATHINNNAQETPPFELEFRNRFPANYRAIDGHYVRSRGELLIDNWLYMFGVVHAFERKLPVEELLYCDFYLPGGGKYTLNIGDLTRSLNTWPENKKNLRYIIKITYL
jgi:hypothetical protein